MHSKLRYVHGRNLINHQQDPFGVKGQNRKNKESTDVRRGFMQMGDPNTSEITTTRPFYRRYD